jgi:hypothetical protein
MLKSILAWAGIETEVPTDQGILEFSMTVSRVIGALLEAMTPEQRRRAAAKLRTLAGSADQRAYFMGLADDFEEFPVSRGVRRSGQKHQRPPQDETTAG